jgi:hypothetical protein
VPYLCNRHSEAPMLPTSVVQEYDDPGHRLIVKKETIDQKLDLRQ